MKNFPKYFLPVVWLKAGRKMGDWWASKYGTLMEAVDDNDSPTPLSSCAPDFAQGQPVGNWCSYFRTSHVRRMSGFVTYNTDGTFSPSETDCVTWWQRKITFSFRRSLQTFKAVFVFPHTAYLVRVTNLRTICWAVCRKYLPRQIEDSHGTPKLR
jgi:hypothetical protein